MTFRLRRRESRKYLTKLDVAVEGAFKRSESPQLWLYGLLRDSRKLTLAGSNTRLSDASFRLEPQRFGHSRLLYAPVQLPFLGLMIL